MPPTPPSPPSTLLADRLNLLLSQRAHPKTLCPSEVARSLSAVELSELEVSDWRHLMPLLREMAFEARDRGEIEILQRGEVIGMDRDIGQVKGPVRLRATRIEEPAT